MNARRAIANRRRTTKSYRTNKGSSRRAEQPPSGRLINHHLWVKGVFLSEIFALWGRAVKSY